MKTSTLAKILGLSVLCSLALNTARAEDTEGGSDQNSKRALTESKPKGERKGHGDGARKARILAKFDKNGDGKLDDNEKAAAKQGREKHRKEFVAKFDKNGDGKLDEGEKATAKAAMKRRHNKHHGEQGGESKETVQ